MAAFRIPFFMLLMIAALFGPAGRWDLPFFWAIIAMYALFIAIVFPLMDPALRKERMSPGPGGKDRQIMYWAMPFVLTSWILASLDVGRYHWSDSIPLAARLAGLAFFGSGLALTLRAMLVNRFFSPVVRIQHERGHVVVTAGPYQFIRHPGYLGTLLSGLGAAVAMGSWWALAPMAGYVVLVIRRLVVEDRFLQIELEGYRDYAQRVRFRLFPGVW